VTQHASLSPERWTAFSRDQQLLMIANEMNRCQKLQGQEDRERFRHGLERVLRLTDLTVQVNARHGFRRELLRWRGLVAEIYVASEPDRAGFRLAFRALLRFSRATSEQIPYVLGEETGTSPLAS